MEHAVLEGEGFRLSIVRYMTLRVHVQRYFMYILFIIIYIARRNSVFKYNRNLGPMIGYVLLFL